MNYKSLLAQAFISSTIDEHKRMGLNPPNLDDSRLPDALAQIGESAETLGSNVKLNIRSFLDRAGLEPQEYAAVEAATNDEHILNLIEVWAVNAIRCLSDPVEIRKHDLELIEGLRIFLENLYERECNPEPEDYFEEHA